MCNSTVHTHLHDSEHRIACACRANSLLSCVFMASQTIRVATQHECAELADWRILSVMVHFAWWASMAHDCTDDLPQFIDKGSLETSRLLGGSSAQECHQIQCWSADLHMHVLVATILSVQGIAII